LAFSAFFRSVLGFLGLFIIKRQRERDKDKDKELKKLDKAGLRPYSGGICK
jgi:hypothetical protein